MTPELPPDVLHAATGCGLLRASMWTVPVASAMQAWGINTVRRQACFLAQIAHESASFSRLEENLNYRAERLLAVWPKRFPALAAAGPFANNPRALANHVYANRMGNGDEASGDGWRDRGRGLKQLTGRNNIGAYQQASGRPVLVQPELLLERDAAADSAGWFWHANNCNALADVLDVMALTRRTNGGMHGLAERQKLTQRALGVRCIAARKTNTGKVRYARASGEGEVPLRNGFC